MPPFRAAQIVGARFAFFVSLAHVKDRLKQGDGVFESGRPTPVEGLEDLPRTGQWIECTPEAPRSGFV